MDLLARREYSRAELSQRLCKRFGDIADVELVLTQLQDDNLQSDQRFTEAFLRSRIGRGQGLQRVRLDIRQRGISDSLFAEVLEALEMDWYKLAREVVERKFGVDPAEDPKERARRARFLQYRGFSFDQISYALSASGRD